MTRTKIRTDPSDRADEGFTLIELLVAIGLFSVLGTLLLGLALSTSRVTNDVRTLTNVNEESRLAMERMVRELRQANIVEAVSLPPSSTTALTFWTDFDGDTVRDTTAADPEVLTYRWNPVTSRLTLTANDAGGTAITRPVLAATVSSFSLGLRSSEWQYDADGDGVTTWQELDTAGAPIGNGDGAPNGTELGHIDRVEVQMTVLDGARAQSYSSQVDLRNRN